MVTCLDHISSVGKGREGEGLGGTCYCTAQYLLSGEGVYLQCFALGIVYVQTALGYLQSGLCLVDAVLQGFYDNGTYLIEPIGAQVGYALVSLTV